MRAHKPSFQFRSPPSRGKGGKGGWAWRIPLIAALVLLSACQRITPPPLAEPFIEPSASFGRWQELTLSRWVQGDLDGAEEAFTYAYRNGRRSEAPEVLVPFLVDWAEMSLARRNAGAIPEQLAEARDAIEPAVRTGQFGRSSALAFNRLIDTLLAAARRDIESPESAAAALEALGPSPWGVDDQFYLGLVRAEQGRVADAVRAFRTYRDATPRLSQLRRAVHHRATANAYLATHASGA